MYYRRLTEWEIIDNVAQAAQVLRPSYIVWLQLPKLLNRDTTDEDKELFEERYNYYMENKDDT